MARPQKKGLDYFSFDVDFFSDKKIRVLKGRYGVDGIAIFIYLLTLIYRNGYYITYDDDLKYVISDELNMSHEKIEQIINFLCERSLFDNKLFVSDKVLTSHGIQMRYQQAKALFRQRSDIDAEFWVLKQEETQDFIKVTQNSSFVGQNPDYCVKNNGFVRKKPPKEKESKINKNKEKERKETLSPSAAASREKSTEKNVLSDTVFANLVKMYEENIGTISSITAQHIADWLNDVNSSLIEYAIEEAVGHEARSWAYIERIIKNHFDAGRTTREAAEKVKNTFKPAETNNEKYETFHNNYNYDEIENKIWNS